MTPVMVRMLLEVKKGFPSNGWLQRALREVYTMKKLMW